MGAGIVRGAWAGQKRPAARLRLIRGFTAGGGGAAATHASLSIVLPMHAGRSQHRRALPACGQAGAWPKFQGLPILAACSAAACGWPASRQERRRAVTAAGRGRAWPGGHPPRGRGWPAGAGSAAPARGGTRQPARRAGKGGKTAAGWAWAGQRQPGCRVGAPRNVGAPEAAHGQLEAAWAWHSMQPRGTPPRGPAAPRRGGASASAAMRAPAGGIRTRPRQAHLLTHSSAHAADAGGPLLRRHAGADATAAARQAASGGGGKQPAAAGRCLALEVQPHAPAQPTKQLPLRLHHQAAQPAERGRPVGGDAHYQLRQRREGKGVGVGVGMGGWVGGGVEVLGGVGGLSARGVVSGPGLRHEPRCPRCLPTHCPPTAVVFSAAAPCNRPMQPTRAAAPCNRPRLPHLLRKHGQQLEVRVQADGGQGAVRGVHGLEHPERRQQRRLGGCRAGGRRRRVRQLSSPQCVCVGGEQRRRGVRAGAAAAAVWVVESHILCSDAVSCGCAHPARSPP